MYILRCSLSLMAFALLFNFPREVREKIREFSHGRRCWICEEGKGLLCCINNREYEMYCLICYVGMLPDETQPRLVDGIRNGVHSYSAVSYTHLTLPTKA